MSITILPVFMPLEEAARLLHTAPARLRRLVEAGIVSAAKLPDGGIVINMDDVKSKQLVSRRDFQALEETPITLSEAARKYDLNHSTLSRWTRAGHIRKIGEDKNRILLNEADIAYICAVSQAIGGLKQGQSIERVLSQFT